MIRWIKRIKEDRKELQELRDRVEANDGAFYHLSTTLFEFYKVWQRHEGKNKPPRVVHDANQFVFERDNGELGEKLRQKKLDKRAEIWKKGNGICYLCNKPLDSKNWTVDHVVPASKGGGEGLNNLMPTHKACNEQKADRILGPGGTLYYGDPWG